MFDIGGGEFVLIIVVALMLFGSENIPQIARSLGKGMAQLKNATNDIKHEIQKSAEDNGLDLKSITGGINEEIEKARTGLGKMVEDHVPTNPLKNQDVTSEITENIRKVEQSIDDIAAGPVKRTNG